MAPQNAHAAIAFQQRRADHEPKSLIVVLPPELSHGRILVEAASVARGNSSLKTPSAKVHNV